MLGRIKNIYIIFLLLSFDIWNIYIKISPISVLLKKDKSKKFNGVGKGIQDKKMELKFFEFTKRFVIVLFKYISWNSLEPSAFDLNSIKRFRYP